MAIDRFLDDKKIVSKKNTSLKDIPGIKIPENINEPIENQNTSNIHEDLQNDYLQEQQLQETDKIIQETNSRVERLQSELEDIYNDESIIQPEKANNPNINISMSEIPHYLVYRDTNNQTQIETAAYYLGREDNKQRIINKDIVLKKLSKETVNQLIQTQIEIEIISKMKKRISKNDIKLQKRLQIKLDEQKERAKLLDIRLSIISDMITNISNLLNE